MEYLYRVDKEDKVIGKVERNKAHEKLIKHRTGIIFLVDKENRVYLTRRSSKKKTFPGRYDSSSSFHVSYGESYEEAAKREAKEELGIEKPLKMLGKFSHCDPPSNHICAVFRMEYKGEKIDLGPEEMKGGRFYTLEKAKKIINKKKLTPWLRDGWKFIREDLESS